MLFYVLAILRSPSAHLPIYPPTNISNLLTYDHPTTQLSTYPPTHLPKYHISLYPPTRLPPITLPNYPPTYLPNYLTTLLPNYPPTHLPNYLTIHLRTYLTIHLPTYPTTHLPTTIIQFSKPGHLTSIYSAINPSLWLDLLSRVQRFDPRPGHPPPSGWVGVSIM